jgi:multidrug efflux pump subunit AcrA (membrane-fusion protein)
VRDAQHVARGTELARLENPLLTTRLAALQSETRAAMAEHDGAASLGDAVHLGALRSLTAQLQSTLDKMEVDEKNLTLRAPVDGTVIGRDLSLRPGTLLRRGDLFCEILPDGPLKVVVAVNERDASRVSAGQRAEFRLKSDPSMTFHGRVLSIDAMPSDKFPHESLGEHAGGTVPSTVVPGQPSDPATRAVPTGMIYAARVAIENPDGILRPGMSGRLRIDCGKQALGAVLWDSITSMIRTDFRL